MVSGHDTVMTNEQASEMVLTWCRSSAAQLGGRRPVMRNDGEGGWRKVIDASMFVPDVLAEGPTWVEVCAALGCYGPQWEPAPTKRDTRLGAPSLAYMQAAHRHYRRGRR